MTRLEQLEPFVEEPLPSCEVSEESLTALGSILAHRKDLPPMRFDCGVDDSLLDANRELHAVLEKEGVEHIYEEFAGGHEWPYWERHLVDSLRFFAENLC
jgi:enterochelin esterase-like enzyme